MSNKELYTYSPDETKGLGEKLGKYVQPGDVICLNGDLGAGKTAFSQGVASGLGITRPVTSPTFTLINEYEGRLPLYHFDVYRLGGPEEMADLGYEEYFFGQGVCLVEWASLVEEVLPAERLEITLLRDDHTEDRRKIVFHPIGKRYIELIEEMV